MRGPTFRYLHGYYRIERVGLFAWRWTVHGRQRITLEDGSWFWRIGAEVHSGDCWFRWQAVNQARIGCARLSR